MMKEEEMDKAKLNQKAQEEEEHGFEPGTFGLYVGRHSHSTTRP